MNHNASYIAYMRNYFRKGKLLTHPRSATILNDADDQQSTYYIASGYVRIYSLNRRNEQYTHIIYGPGELFPLTWMAGPIPKDVLYETLSDVQIFRLPIKQLNKDMLTDSVLAYGVLQQVIEQYRIYTGRVDNLEYKYASERLAYRLILLANRFGIDGPRGTTIEPLMTHQLIGTSLNLSRESVSREMEKLVRRGLVHYNELRQIVIPDLQKLATELQVPNHQGLNSRNASTRSEVNTHNW